MAQLVLAAAGAALAGPLGFSAGIGWMAGSLLASVLFPTKTQGPRLDDRTIVGTEYGQAIPWVAGSPRLAGQYIWASPLREIANTQRAGKGGGAKVTTYTYECDVMIILTENVTEGVARDWLNGELVRNGVTIKDGIWNGVTVYTGAADQLPDPTYEAAVGAGNAPAYRGRTTIVIRGLQLGGGKQLPNLEHQISQPTGILEDLVFYAPYDSDFNDQSDYAVTAVVTESMPIYGFQVAEGKFGGALGPKGSNFVASNTNQISYLNPAFAVSGAFTVGVWLQMVTYPVVGNTTGPGDPIIWFDKSSGGLSNQSLRLTTNKLGFNVQLGSSSGSVDVPANLGEWLFLSISRGAGTTVRIKKNGQLINALDASVLSDTDVLYVMGNPFTASPHTDCRIDDLFLVDGRDLYPLDGDMPFSPIGRIEKNPFLSEVLGQLLLRAGYSASQFSIQGLNDKIVHGYATGQVTSTRTDLETLRPFGLYEANCSDKLYIFPRALTPVGSVPWSDLGASESPDAFDEPFDLKLASELEMPAQIAVRYKNATADGNVGTEFSDRLVSSMVSTQVAEMAITMTPAQAKTVVDTMLKDLMAGLGRATLKLGGRKYARYEPGDVLTTTDPDGRVWRFRILTKRDLLIMLEWDVVIDDASALDTPAITYEGYVSTENPVRVAPTEAEFLALPPLRDADATAPGAYVAVAPAKTSASDEWPGCVVVRARLPEAFEQQFTTGDACVMGACLTTLGDFPRGSGVQDNSQTLRVRVLGELASSNWVDFHADRTVNAALVGDEPIRFMTATFVELDGQYRVYDLTGLLRGQLGQEHQIAGHLAGERFVLLNNGIRRMASETTDIGQEHQVKAVTLNTLLSSVTDEPFTDDGIALRPYSPAHLLALAQPSGDLAVSWVRRSRLVARYTDAGVFAPLGEASEAYRVKVFDGAAQVRTVDVTSPAWTYAAADIAADGFVSGDHITITVQQLSDAVGEGFAATLETTAP